VPQSVLAIATTTTTGVIVAMTLKTENTIVKLSSFVAKHVL